MAKKNTQKRFEPKLHIKKGDTVQVLAGKYKGDRGEILEVFPSKNRAVVSDVNIVYKHKKPTENEEGGIIEQEASIHISNLMVVDPSTDEPTKIGRKIVDGKRVRYSKKSGEIID